MVLNETMSMDLRSVMAAIAHSPEGVLEEVLRRVGVCADDAVWIHRLSRDHVHQQLAGAKARKAGGASLPLFGVPFAVKDNIDVAGLPTTAACPDFSHIAAKTATSVQRLIDAGAILIGKTNLDQFATGLVGTRSPYGACRNVFDDRYISGGSSSGSAVAVAAGLVTFSLGTDTAGSGRVPAGFNNIVGLKPTRGLVSASGVVPACRSLDCVSVFALTCDDAATVLQVMAGHDATDSFSRIAPLNWAMSQPATTWRFGIVKQHAKFFGNAEYAAEYDAAIARIIVLGGTAVEVDYEPFAQAASLLYGGPWVAERYAAIADFIERRPQSLLPVTRSIIEKATQITAVQTFNAMYELTALRAQADHIWRQLDLLLLPTAGTIYTHAEVEADPMQLNANLGCYTNFVNLLDCAAIAVPSGMTKSGLPFGVTLVAPAWRDAMLWKLGARYHAETKLSLGATGHAMPATEVATPGKAPAPGFVRVAVVGAHLSGQPLNWQLTQRNATLVRTCRTAPVYRFYALTNSAPLKPGLVRVPGGEKGHAIEVELWDMPHEAFGSFVNEIPAPLGIGTLTLEDQTTVKGFVCEPYGVVGTTEISHLGGWRAYLATRGNG